MAARSPEETKLKHVAPATADLELMQKARPESRSHPIAGRSMAGDHYRTVPLNIVTTVFWNSHDKCNVNIDAWPN